MGWYDSHGYMNGWRVWDDMVKRIRQWMAWMGRYGCKQKEDGMCVSDNQEMVK